MRIYRTYLLLVIAGFGFFLNGCQKPGPVELQDTQGSQVLGIQAISDQNYTEYEQDTTGLVASDKNQYLGQLIVSGVRYDVGNETHTVSTARAVFVDTNQPIVRNGRTLGYWSVGVGAVLIDGLPLFRTERVIRYPVSGGFSDTIAGWRYELLSKDGVGGRGFGYSPNHKYEWANIGSANVSFNVQQQSARGIEVVRPTASDVVFLRQDLLVEWSGGEDVVYLIINIPQGGRGQIPVLRMQLRSDEKRVAIPTKVLQLLPINRSSKFMFSFISQRDEQIQVQGFTGNVLVHSASIHNILLSVQR